MVRDVPLPDGPDFTFVHAADLHLDTPFHGIGAVAPAVADALREASLDAFDAIVDLAISRASAFVVIAGDVYDGAERGLRAQLRFRAGLQRLSDEGIASFVVHGNHDPVEEGWSAVGGRWPERTTVFGPHERLVVPVIRDGATIANVQGVSFATRAEHENLALRLGRDGSPGLAVGVLHCNVEGSPDHYAPYSPCTVDDLVATGLDYLALGHVHERRILHGEIGRPPWIVYPGNSQARSPRPTERGPKGAVVVHASGTVVTAVEFVPCDRVRFDEVVVDVGEIADLGLLADELASGALAALDGAAGRSLVVRGRLVGRGPVHADLARPGSLDGLTRALRDRAPVREPFVWWDEVGDESLGPIDLDAIRSRGDFAADLLGVSDTLRAAPDLLSATFECLADDAPRSLRADLARLADDGAWLDDAVATATRVVLDALAEGER